MELKTIRHSINLLKDGKKLGIFPEGRRVLPGEEPSAADGVKTGVAMIAVRAGVPIIPIYLSSRKKLFQKHLLRIGAPISAEKGEESTSDCYQRIATQAFQTILDLGANE